MGRTGVQPYEANLRRLELSGTVEEGRPIWKTIPLRPQEFHPLGQTVSYEATTCDILFD